MSSYVSIDLHRHRSLVCYRLGDGSLKFSQVLNDPETLAAAVCAAGPGPVAAVEATIGWYWAVDALEAAGVEVKLVHPAGVLWGNRRVKNDRADCADLLDLLERGRLPLAWISPLECRELRELVRGRHRLVEARSTEKNQVHGVIQKAGLRPPVSDVFGTSGRDWLRDCAFSPAHTKWLDLLVESIDFHTEQISQLDSLIAGYARQHPDYQSLVAIPQIGPVIAAVVIAEVWDITRFKDARAFACWCGLTPRRRESDNKGKNGRVSKQGSRLMRWALTEAAVRQSSGPAKHLQDQIKARGASPKTAHTAGARKLSEHVFYAMRDGHVRALGQMRSAA